MEIRISEPHLIPLSFIFIFFLFTALFLLYLKIKETIYGSFFYLHKNANMSIKYLLLTFLLSSVIFSYSQGTKGMKYLGGSIGFNSQKASSSQMANTQKESGFYLNPSLGWFLKENLVGGIELYTNSSTSESGSPSTITKRHAFGLGVLGRSYKAIGKNFYLFAHTNFSFSSDRYNYTVAGNSQSKSSGYSLQAGLYPGLSFAVNKKLQIETALGSLFYAGYSTNSNPGSTQTPDLTINRFSAGINLNAFSSLSFGIRFLLD